MPKDELKATDATLQGLLEGERLYLAPILQRRFVWTRKELDELWDDIDQIMQGVDKSRFLGALVLQHRSGGLAFEPNTYWIIDGQQRLTTLYLLLLVVVELSEQRGRTKRLAADLQQVLLNQSNQHKNEPKLRPTNSDLRQFGDVLKQVESVTIAIPEAVGHYLGRLRNMHEMLRGDLEQRLEEEGSSYLSRLADLVLMKLKFVQILTSDDENPHQVFDRLNNAGQRLQIVDLVRNAVFQKFGGRVADQETFYNTSWKPFEDEMDEAIDGYFFPFALIHKPSTTQAQVFGDLKARWRNVSAPDILEELKRYVPEYLALARGGSIPIGCGSSEVTGRRSS